MKENNNKIHGGGNRDYAIDIIKFIAMIMVLGLHQQFGRHDNCCSTQVIASISGIAIPLFFMVNGYLMTFRKLDYHYVVNKIYRILRFIFFIGILYWLFFHVRKGELSPITMLKNDVLSLIQLGDMSIFWFFGAMMILYALMPIINKMTNTYKGYLPSMLLSLIVIQFIIFILNIKWKFEGDVIQTFRVWNWIYYFLIGAVIKRIHEKIKIRINFVSILILAIVYIWFIRVTYNTVEVRDRYFGAVTCTVYSVVLFIFIVQRIKQNNNIIKNVSNLFLPIYSLHPLYFMVYYHFVDTTFMGELSPIFDFTINTVVLIFICYWLMKVPCMNNIFRI